LTTAVADPPLVVDVVDFFEELGHSSPARREREHCGGARATSP
jgi:hypothetical protein